MVAYFPTDPGLAARRTGTCSRAYCRRREKQSRAQPVRPRATSYRATYSEPPPQWKGPAQAPQVNCKDGGLGPRPAVPWRTMLDRRGRQLQVGTVTAGMAHQGYDLQLTRYDARGWRATFYASGMERSVMRARNGDIALAAGPRSPRGPRPAHRAEADTHPQRSQLRLTILALHRQPAQLIDQLGALLVGELLHDHLDGLRPSHRARKSIRL